MLYDLLIKNGRIIDPSSNIDKIGNISVKNGRIASLFEEDAKASVIIDAHGCLVVPGLIDFHAHLFFQGTEIGLPPDTGMLSFGVTTAIDAGSAGTANYESFSREIISKSMVRIKSLINVSPTGLMTVKYNENLNPQYFDLNKLNALFEKYDDELIGLKIRLSKEIVGELGIAPLQKTLEMAEQLNVPLVIHTTNPPDEVGVIADLLRKKDIYCHVYHGKGKTIIGDDGKINPSINEARKRGVLFDTADGKNHFAFKTFEQARRQGFHPDIISTDLTFQTLYQQPIFGLPFVLSKYLCMGLSINEIIASCTIHPAKWLNMENEIGTLKPNACGDIAIFKLVEKKNPFYDSFDEMRIGNQLLVPQATIRRGNIVFRQIDF